MVPSHCYVVVVVVMVMLLVIVIVIVIVVFFYVQECDILSVPSFGDRKVRNIYWRMRFHHKDMEFFIFSKKICFNS
jgi:hypothetical protein